MSLYDFRTNEQPYAKAGISFFVRSFNPVKSFKYLFLALFVDTDPLVLYKNCKITFIYNTSHFYQFVFRRVLDGIGEKIDKNLRDPFTISKNMGIFPKVDLDCIILFYQSHLFYNFFN